MPDNISMETNLTPHIKGNHNKDYPSYFNEESLLTGIEFLKELGSVVVQEYDIDEDSRKEWYENSIKDMKLFKAFMEPKTFPWANCSNVALPMLSIAVLQFHARAYDALIPAKGVAQILNTTIQKGQSPEMLKSLSDRADRVEKHMNYQLLYEMEEFEEGMDSMLMEESIVGTSFKKTFWDATLKRNRDLHVSAFDVCFNYGFPSVYEATRVTHIIKMYPNDIRKRVNAEVFDRDAWELKGGSVVMSQKWKRDELNKIDGTKEINLSMTNAPRFLLEQKRFCDIDGNGIATPYIVTVDYETHKVLRIVDCRVEDSLGKEVLDDYLTQYNFLPNPTGGYGIGFGMLMRGLNTSANSILNEIIDAGTLANLQGGFVSKRSGIKKGSLSFSMGEYKEVDSYVDDIRKAIYNFDFKGPNQTLYAVLGLLYEYSKLVSSVSETMTGQLPASDTPASTVMALVEEGRKVFSSIHKRNYRSFKRELRKLYRLNRMFLDTASYFAPLTEQKIPGKVKEQILRADYADTHDILPVADPMITSKAEKVMMAKATREIVLTDPVSSKNVQNIYQATLRMLDALGVPNLNEVYSEPAAQKPQDIPPEQENAAFIQNKDAEPLPQQDHERHLKVHEELINGPYAPAMKGHGKRLLDEHKQKHISLMYLKEKKPQQVPPAGGDQLVAA